MTEGHEVYALNAVWAGLDTIDLLRHRLPIRGVIGPSDPVVTQGAAGAAPVREFCDSRSLRFIPVHSYSLMDPRDEQAVSSILIDVLLVVGWQRLVPGWLLSNCRIAAVGVHGSPFGISGGRGRSPLNWALILGAKEFSLSVFRLAASADSGPVYATRAFPITEEDDIVSCYKKTSLLAAEMIAEALRSGAVASGSAQPQHGPVRYMPQRTGEDGAIDWRRSSSEILRFVRALTRPYPGAFSQLGGSRIFVWRARHFTWVWTRPSNAPGEVLHVSADGTFLVRTGDGALLIDDHTVDPAGAGTVLRSGLVLPSVDFQEQIRLIVQRHERRYPSRKIAEALLRLSSADDVASV